MAKKAKKMIKIVYFDEGSATDFIYVLEGGKNTDKKEHIVSKATEIAVGAEAEAKKSAEILSIISAKVGAAANADFSREGSTIITKAIENTILTDYLDYAAKAGKPYVRIFSDCKPYPYPESFAYFKMLTPYLKMTNGQIEVSDGLSLNLALMDEALDSGRGYYELMADCAGETVVLRFNIKAFRNNYFISDFSDDYPSLTEGTIESFTNFVLRYDIDNLYLQNPPDSIARHIQELSCVNCKIDSQDYKIIDIDLLREIKNSFSDAVIGQELAQKQILAALYNVAKRRYNKPCVILLYGSTGIGKTESAKFIAATLGEELFRKQFSMLHSEEFSSYIFGGKHNQNSLAKELLERESNIILFDEFDKPHPVFHSAFYQLFDEGIYVDRNFTVKMKD